MTELASFNGNLVPRAAMQLAPTDAGFVWGATVAERCRTFRHRLDQLSDHVSRFRRSCVAARVPQPVPDAEVARRAEELVAHNLALAPAATDAALILFATPGPQGGPPTLGLHTAPLEFAAYRRLFVAGARLATPAVRHVPAACVDPRIKQRSRLHWWLAEREVQDTDPGATALLLDLDGAITETATANFLLVCDGRIITPSRARVLNGISLQTVETLCNQLAIPFEERLFRLDDCLAADEAMLTSTSFCLAPVCQINGRAFPGPHPMFERLLAAWSERVGLDIRGQVLHQAPGPAVD